MASDAPARAVPETTTATVVRMAPVTPRMVRVTFRAPGFRGAGFADDWIGMFLGEAGDHRSRRTYTIRAERPEREELDLDFALHSDGLAMRWLADARPGTQVEWWNRTGGSYAPPVDTAWQLLAGDLAALPALGRIVESLPAGARATVLAETYDAADAQTWETEGDVEVRWLSGSGDGRAPSRLAGAVLGHRGPAGPGYVWMAGETRTVREVRRTLRHERGLAGDRYALTGYWLTDAAAWAARFAPLEAELTELWARGEREGRDPEEIEDEYQAALEEAGL